MTTNTFRSCFYVTRIEPVNAVDACKVYNKSTKKTTTAKGAKSDSHIIY